IRTALADPDVPVVVRPHLPAVTAALEDLAASVGDARPDALSTPGVTVEALRGFAAAAARFYRAAPWRHLTNDDLIRVEAPAAGKGLALAVVMGGGSDIFGLSFLSSVEQFELIAAGAPPEEAAPLGAWAVYFDAAWEIPAVDLMLWERERLPLAGDQAYPFAVRIDADGGVHRPDAGLFAYFEGLLAALADTSEDEMDRGRWTRRVTTAQGEKSFTLALPDLVGESGRRKPRRPIDAPDPRVLERFNIEIERTFASREFESLDEANTALERFSGVSVDELPSTATTPLERAQDLMYQAFDARGRRQLQLVRQALATSPDCTDAYVLLAERAADLEETRRMYADGVAAGERTIPAAWFEDPEEGVFWGRTSTRPYMRAREGLAATLAALGRPDDAIAHYEALLRLNPNDNQGVRFELLRLLVEAERGDAIIALLSRYPDEDSPVWEFTAAFYLWRHGDERHARSRVRRGLRRNRHAAAYLLGRREDDGRPIPAYRLGSHEEAIAGARAVGDLWRRTPEAASWLRRIASVAR
ncbi:MAG: tetratricopeptide repeat protein, partial [Vicinamibacterales bacterium]